MSYILEALRKAESERRLGQVPGVDAQPVAALAPVDEGGWWRKPWPWIALAAAMAVAAAAAWLRPWQDAAAVRATGPAPATQQLAQAPAPAPVPVPAAPQAPTPAPAQQPAAPVQQAPAQAAAGQPEKPAQAAQPSSPKPAKPAKKPRETKVAKQQHDARAAAHKPAQADGASSGAPVVAALRDLPDNIQREIPALTVGGYIYASNPAERSILINNKLLREGEQVAPGLMLERMMPREAIFNYRGYRYRMSY